MVKVGEFEVKGSVYEDITSILGNNGYAVEVFTPKYDFKEVNLCDVKHIIRVYKVCESEE